MPIPTECRVVLGQAWTFLDGECPDDETYVRLCRHLDTCENCFSEYALGGRLKALIARKCGGERMPTRWKWTPTQD